MPIPSSPAYDAESLRAAARASKDAGQTRRLLALADIYDGASRTEAAAMGNVTLQVIRDWVLKLNAHGPDSLVDYKGPGLRRILTEAHRAALAVAIEEGPTPAIQRLSEDRPIASLTSPSKVELRGRSGIDSSAWAA